MPINIKMPIILASVAVLLNTGCTLEAALDSTIPDMTLQKVSPEFVSFSGNTLLEINGDGFSEKTKAYVDEKPCTELHLIDSTKIKCKVPPLDLDSKSESSYVDIRVTNGIKTLNFKGAVKYRSDAVYEVKKFAGVLASSGHRDSTGTKSRFISPSKPLSVGDYVYVSDTASHTIRRYKKTTGELETFAGKTLVAGSADGVGTEATFNLPMGLAHHNGYLYVAENGSCIVRRINIQTKMVERFVGIVQDSIKDGCSTPDETTVADGLTANLSELTSLTTDGTYLYLGDQSQEVRKVDLNGTRTVSLLTPVDDINDYIIDIVYSNNNLYYLGYATTGSDSVVGRVSTIDGTSEILLSGITSRVGGIEIQGTTLYVASATTNTIRKMDLNQTPPIPLQSFFGSGTKGQLDGASATARLFHPVGLSIDGNLLYFTSFGSRNLRQINISEMTVTTLSGAAE